MTGALLDTNVVSELMRKNPNPRVLDWLDTREVAHLWIASITITEIERGILRLGETDRAVALQSHFGQLLDKLFQDRVIAFDRECAENTARYLVRSSNLHPTHHLADSIIAGCAITLSLEVATRNVSDFNSQLVRVVNPWS